MLVYIFLPVYNEEALLDNLLREIYDEFKKKNIQFNLVAVNDGSTDGTANVLEQYKTNHNLSLPSKNHYHDIF